MIVGMDGMKKRLKTPVMLAIALVFGVNAYSAVCLAINRIPIYANGQKGHISVMDSYEPASMKLLASKGIEMTIPVSPENGGFKVTLSGNEKNRYVHGVARLGLGLPIETTMELDIPSMNISIVAFSSHKSRKTLSDAISNHLRSKGWKELPTTQVWKSHAYRNMVIDVHCLPKSKGSHGVIWLHS